MYKLITWKLSFMLEWFVHEGTTSRNAMFRLCKCVLNIQNLWNISPSKTIITCEGYWLQLKLARSVFDLVLNACLYITIPFDLPDNEKKPCYEHWAFQNSYMNISEISFNADRFSAQRCKIYWPQFVLESSVFY